MFPRINGNVALLSYASLLREVRPLPELWLLLEIRLLPDDELVPEDELFSGDRLLSAEDAVVDIDAFTFVLEGNGESRKKRFTGSELGILKNSNGAFWFCDNNLRR